MVNIKTEKGNSRVIINGQAIEIQAEIIQCFISLAENMATINKTSVESAALMIYQVGMSSYANFKGKHKEKTCTENPETNTSAESETFSLSEIAILALALYCLWEYIIMPWLRSL